MNPDSRLLHLPQSSRYAVTAAIYLASRTDDGYHMVGKLNKTTLADFKHTRRSMERS